MTRFLILVTVIAATTQTASASENCWTHNSAEGDTFATVTAACDKAVHDKYLANPHPGTVARAVETFFQDGKKNPFLYRCDASWQGHPTPEVVTVVFTAIAPQDYCNYPIEGPYSNLQEGDGPRDGVPGEPFGELRGRVIAANKGVHAGRVVSDLYGTRGRAALQSMVNGAVETYQTLTESRPGFPHSGSSSSAEVGHAIPAKDVNGCPCGANSPSNAIVHSRGVNGYLNNAQPTQQYLDYVESLPKVEYAN